MRVWLPLDGTLIHRRSAPSRCWYSFTYPWRMESWVSLDGKEGHTNISMTLKPRIELGTLWLEVRDLTICTNNACSFEVFNFSLNIAEPLLKQIMEEETVAELSLKQQVMIMQGCQKFLFTVISRMPCRLVCLTIFHCFSVHLRKYENVFLAMPFFVFYHITLHPLLFFDNR